MNEFEKSLEREREKSVGNELKWTEMEKNCELKNIIEIPSMEK